MSSNCLVFFPLSIISLLTIHSIALLNFSLFAIKAYCGTIETKRLDHSYVCDFLGLDYSSFAAEVDALSRTCSTRLLTNNARLIATQQNIHSILKISFGGYHLAEHSFDGYEAFLKKRSVLSSKCDIDKLDIFSEVFIHYSNNLKSLIVTRIMRRDQKTAQNIKYYLVKVQLSSIKDLYRQIISNGLDLGFVLRLLPRLINLYEASFKVIAPEALDLTEDLNIIIKEFIWKCCQEHSDKIEKPSLFTLQRLAKEFFKMNLNAYIFTLRQGQAGHLYTHIIGEPCKIYKNGAYIGMCYAKNIINLIEQFKLPLCPSAINLNSQSQDKFCYCISSYNLHRGNKARINGSKEYEQEATKSLLKTTIPLMRVPEGTILSTYIMFPKKNLIDLLGKRQKSNFNVTKYISRTQGIKDTPLSFSTISNEKLYIFMNHFANYLYTNANTDLFERENVWV